jgi:aminoglycoside 6-adenylyltransferase
LWTSATPNVIGHARKNMYARIRRASGSKLFKKSLLTRTDRSGRGYSGKYKLKGEEILENKQKICKEMLERFIRWADLNQNIRLTFVWGSRARKINSADEWSDLDLVIVTCNPDELLISNEWITNIGIPKIMFLQDTLCNGKERRVLFNNGLDIDFVVFSYQKFKEVLNSPEILAILNRGMRILFDKDNLTADLKVSNEYIPSQSIPNQEEFINVINDFWYHSVWTAKKLRRGELLQAKAACDEYLKYLLMQLIKWQTYCKNGQNYDTWHSYRFFERWVDPAILTKMQNVYAHYDKEDIWAALFSTMNLFREISEETAVLLEYKYPISADDYATEYVSFLSQER